MKQLVYGILPADHDSLRNPPVSSQLYLYGIFKARPDGEIGPIGIDEGMVYTISDDRVAAVVSDIRIEKIRPERRRLAAHHAVLKTVMETETILPMVFGIIADKPEAIRRILTSNRAEFLDQLKRVDQKQEMGLRVVWDDPNLFEFFVSQHEELEQKRDQIFRGGREPDQGEKIDLGRMFERILADERQLQTERVLEALRPHCFEARENKPRTEREVMNLAFLVGRDKLKDFEDGVFESARLFDHHYAFDFSGPWPPHNFVDVSLST
jgi:hypothetical protein